MAMAGTTRLPALRSTQQPLLWVVLVALGLLMPERNGSAHGFAARRARMASVRPAFDPGKGDDPAGLRRGTRVGVGGVGGRGRRGGIGIRRGRPGKRASSRVGSAPPPAAAASSVAWATLLLSRIRPARAAAAAASGAPASSPSYLLTRILFLRLLAVVHAAAFAAARFQNRGLIGDAGIAPARGALDAAARRGEARSARRREWLAQRRRSRRSRGGGASRASEFLARCRDGILDGPPAAAFRDGFWHRTDRAGRPLPTLLWLARDRSRLNPWLDGLANAGLCLSSLVLATGSANVPLVAGLWLIQRSFMSVGGPFYGYGWEPQLAELTFHALFLAPLWSMDPFFGASAAGAAGAFPVPALVIWAVRWYLFKIMVGAGLIKVKSSDPKWKPGDLSAMDYFYETQPVPNPFTRYFHFMPKAWHRFEVWTNHFVELVAPFLLLMPFRSLRVAGGLIQIMFQMILISSGNLSFLNWLTIVPAIFCLDDAFLANNLPTLVQKIALGTPATQSYIQAITSGTASFGQPSVARTIVSVAFFLLMAKLNINVVRNLCARRQLMNASFDKLKLCGSYGAFGVVSEQREELIVESASDIAGPWREYHFKVKPGDVRRRPRWISPYHHRIDWQLWIASVSGRVERSPWIYSFLLKLLRQEKDVIGLIESDPWKPDDGSAEGNADNGVNRPKYIRVERYRYMFYDRKNGNCNEDEPPYWVRERVGRYFPRQGVMTVDMLEELVNGR